MMNDDTHDPELDSYLQSLSPKEIQAYHIAKNHLGMTYQYEKSLCYFAWKKEQKEQKEQTK